ncbi:MAG TPA: hypothetical protein VGM50_02315 [Gemmatimonadaceae bacterium]
MRTVQGMGEAGGPKVITFPNINVAAAALARAAVDLARSPKDEKLRKEYDATMRGLLHVYGCDMSREHAQICTKHFIWHRNALRKALEDPEVQSTDARYIGYLNGLRRVAKELNVQWPPYALEEWVHDDVPEEALQPPPAPIIEPARQYKPRPPRRR